MTPDKWEQVKQVFHEALAYEPAQRAAFLEQACGEDRLLRAEVESLLASHQQAESFIEAPASDIAAALLAEEQAELSSGQMVGNFRIANLLATGGMGQVYLADDTRLGRKVALKLLPPQFTVNADRVHRFDQEARAASALNHPNIVTILDIGQTDSLHFMATEFVDGQTLREHLTNARMTVGEVLDVAMQVASALQAAHEAGIVHRDIKPENIMLRRDGFVKVLDFGLAKLAPEQTVLMQQSPVGTAVQTNPGMIMGTVGYMSPEQARGVEVDARTDLWSLGVVLYEMVAGRAPFEGETASHVIVSILESAPAALGLEVPALERIITQALHKERDQRYQTAAELVRDLKNLKEELNLESRLKVLRTVDGNDVSTGRRSTAEYLVNGIRRHKKATVFLSVAAALVLTPLIYLSNLRSGELRDPIDSVAVLSFVIDGGDANLEYLADGITNSLTEGLSRLPNLRVISLSTVGRYKGEHVDPQQVGRELNVRAVLRGKVSHRAEGLVISVELIDARDNRRLWDGQFDGQPLDILAMQNEIKGEIAGNIRPTLASYEKQKLTQQHTTNGEAYQAYARGHFLLEKRTPDAVKRSVEYLEEAVRLDPNYALAYATLSYAYLSSGNLGSSPPMEVLLTKARAAVARALELDHSLAEAHTALGHIRSADWDWPGADTAFKSALELNPNSAFAHSNYAFYLIAMKRFDEAVAESRRAVELEPTSVFYNRNVALNLYFARQYDEAIEQGLKTLELDPIMPTAYAWIAKSYEQKGLYRQAIEPFIKELFFTSGPEVEAALTAEFLKSGWKGFWQKALALKMREHAKQGDSRWYGFAEIYARLGERDKTFAALEQAYEKRNRTLKFVVADPLFDSLRSDPRYADLVQRMGLQT